MPHKYIASSTIKKQEQRIQDCETFIKRTQKISGGGADGFSALKEQLKDFRDTAKEKKDNALDLISTDDKGRIFPVDMQQKIAHVCRGQEKSFEIILDLIENSNESISYYEDERLQLMSELAEMKKMDVRIQGE